MARLITKFKYLKPGRGKSVGGYAKYIATREGVDKVDESQRFAPATVKQKDMIAKLIRDFPDSRDSLEYEDYNTNGTVGSASEFIRQTVETNAYCLMNNKTYADYIATRPRAQRFGSHGLFTDDGVQVQLEKVSQELNLHEGNVWTAIISLRREDAQRLGFDSGERWRDMLRTQTKDFAENLKIPMEHLKWFAAFHNEGNHPHVHMIFYSAVPQEGYLTKQGVMNLRSSLAQDIFKQDMESVYEKQTEQRDELRRYSRDLIEDIISHINSGGYENKEAEELLLRLAEKLSRTNGKKVYGYLKADVKDIVDRIVDILASDERIAELYDLWYKAKEENLKLYSSELPPHVPLSQNTEFKTIRNAVITEAMKIAEELYLKPQPNTTDDTDDKQQNESDSQSGNFGQTDKSENLNKEHRNNQSHHTQNNVDHAIYTATGITRLFNYMSKIIQNNIPNREISVGTVDRKLRRKIQEKKQDQGHKME